MKGYCYRDSIREDPLSRFIGEKRRDEGMTVRPGIFEGCLIALKLVTRLRSRWIARWMINGTEKRERRKYRRISTEASILKLISNIFHLPKFTRDSTRKIISKFPPTFDPSLRKRDTSFTGSVSPITSTNSARVGGRQWRRRVEAA